MATTTFTYAVLEVSEETFKEIAEKLRKAGYTENFKPDGSINMTGIAVALIRESVSPLYYRVYTNKNGNIVFPCLQGFDEVDYRKERFLTEEKFDTEEKARAWYEANKVSFILEWPKPE